MDNDDKCITPSEFEKLENILGNCFEYDSVGVGKEAQRIADKVRKFYKTHGLKSNNVERVLKDWVEASRKVEEKEVKVCEEMWDLEWCGVAVEILDPEPEPIRIPKKGKWGTPPRL